MGDIVRLTASHSLVGTWRDSDLESGTTVQFTVARVGMQFEVRGVDTSDGEQLTISNVKLDGRVLTFVSLVPSTSHRIEYAFELITPSEVRVRYTATEQWGKVD